MKMAIRSATILWIVTSSGSALAQAVGTTQAQASDDGSKSGLEEVIVTAQKREERLSDVPISIAAVTGEQLEQAGIRSTADLEKIVPGFTFTQSNYGNPVFTIRGVGLYDTAIGVSPTVTVYSDQVPMPYLAMSKGVSLDVERVEVLKGPQGTVFGQNSTGGAVNYIAAKPGQSSSAGIDLTYGRYSDVEARGYVSVPLGDTLRARVAARREVSDGWQRSISRPNDDLGAKDFTQGRLIVDWDPSSRISAEFVAEAWRDKSENQAGQFRTYLPSRAGIPDVVAALGSLAPAPEKARAADWDAGADLDRDDRFDRLSARFDVNLTDTATLTSISSYSRYKTDGIADPDGTTFSEYFAKNVADVKSFFQELRGGLSLERLNLTMGVNYQDDVVDEKREFPKWDGSSGVFGPFRFRSFHIVADQKARTSSGFASGNFEILPQLRIEGGIRYTRQDRDYAGCLFDQDGQLSRIAYAASGGTVAPPTVGNCVTLIQTASGFTQQPIINDTLDEDNVSWRTGLNYKPSSDSLVYASVSRGYKAGTFTPLSTVFAVQMKPAVQESVLAYEVGAKAGLANGLATVSAAAFHYDYNDKQILGQTKITGLNLILPQLVNVPKSKVDGAEVDLTLRPIGGLTLRGGLAYIDTTVESHFVTSTLTGAAVDINGQPFPLTSKWQASGSALYEVSVSDTLTASLGGNVTYRSSTVALFSAPGETENRIEPYTIVGLRAGIGSFNDRWRVELWGDNIFNEYYWNNVVKSPDTIARMTGMPATYGITLRMRFN